jgi:DUF1680 family protein
MKRLGIILLLVAIVIAAMSLTLAATSAKAQFFNGNTAASTNTIYANFKLVNTGTDAITLSNVKMRYYFTNDGTQSNSFACDWATAGSSNITGSFVTITSVTGADRYLEVGFSSGAGTLATGAATEVKIRMWKSDWSNFTQTNDYSFNSTATNYIDWTNVTVYISGTLYWGTPAGGGTVTPTPTALTNTPTPVRTATPVITTTPIRTTTPVRTATPIRTITPVRTTTPVLTATPTVTPTRTATPTVTPTQGPTPAPVGYMNRIEPVPGTKINSAFWNARMKNMIVNWIPWCYNQLSNTNLAEGGIDNFVQAGNKLKGLSYKAHVGYWFANAYVLNTVEAMCNACMIDPQGDSAIINAQNAMKTKLNDWIPKILSAQESDGYLQTYITLGNVARWTERDDHEGYVAGYFIEAAIAHYMMTNKTDATLYNAAKKLADCWYNNVGPGKKQWWDGHEEIEQACCRLGVFVNQNEGAGKGDKYIQLAKALMDYRSGGGQYDQSHALPVNQTTAVGHAVRAMYLYSGMEDVGMLLNNSSYTNAAAKIWDNFVNRKWYVTGGVGSGETSEGFGGDYSLPNGIAYCESCAGCGNIFFNHKMNLAYQDGKYADLMETALYNNVLGAFDLNAQNFTYTNPLDSSSGRYTWHNCPCCIGNLPKTMLAFPRWMYAKSGDNNGVYVNMYIGSTYSIGGVAGTNVQLVQATDYPISGNISITVNPTAAATFTVYLRSPNRNVSGCYTVSPAANGISSLSVNGSAVSTSASKGYVAITRTWNPGDVITITLPMQVQRVKANSNIKADTGSVALQYGPLVYNIESVDLSNNTNFNNFVLDPSATLSVQWNASLLGGVNVIKGTFKNGTAMNAIPNYARLNRGGRSAVWIRDTEITQISPIAYAAKASTSYCSSWENITGINDQLVPSSSGDRAGFIYGNYGSPNNSDWIQYDFDKTYTISNTDIYWFSDGGGILAPGSWNMQYWNGSAWVNVGSPSGYGIALNQWNHCTFTSVSTNRVRINITKGAAATGVIEWQIH